jgi:hypothetical protein
MKGEFLTLLLYDHTLRLLIERDLTWGITISLVNRLIQLSPSLGRNALLLTPEGLVTGLRGKKEY